MEIDDFDNKINRKNLICTLQFIKDSSILQIWRFSFLILF